MATCRYCNSVSVTTHSRQETPLLYDHIQCDDCDKICIITDSGGVAWCGSQVEHGKILELTVTKRAK